MGRGTRWNSDGEERKQRAEEVDYQIAELMDSIRRGVAAYRPIGLLTEFQEAIGVQPKRGVATTTPLGTYIFAKARKPERSQVPDWERRMRIVDSPYKELVRLSRVGIPKPGRIVGNIEALRHLEALHAEGLLDPDEVDYMLRLREFWSNYPDADTGVVQPDGTILPIYKPQGRVSSSD